MIDVACRFEAFKAKMEARFKDQLGDTSTVETIQVEAPRVEVTDILEVVVIQTTRH